MGDSKSIKEQNRAVLKREKDLLNAFGRLFNTADGKLVIEYILEKSCISYDPFDASKNSGDTANLLGKQSVGRAIIDRMIEAGVDVRGKVFSRRNANRLQEINEELNKLEN